MREGNVFKISPIFENEFFTFWLFSAVTSPYILAVHSVAYLRGRLPGRVCYSCAMTTLVIPSRDCPPLVLSFFIYIFIFFIMELNSAVTYPIAEMF